MTISEWDNQFWEYLMGRASFPQFDTRTVAYPTNFTPIEVEQTESEDTIEVTVV